MTQHSILSCLRDFHPPAVDINPRPTHPSVGVSSDLKALDLLWMFSSLWILKLSCRTFPSSSASLRSTLWVRRLNVDDSSLRHTQSRTKQRSHYHQLFRCASGVGVASLVHLLAAGGAGDGDNGSQAVGHVLHKLLLQSALPAGVGPGEFLVQVEEAVERHRESDETPAHRTTHLQQQQHTWGAFKGAGLLPGCDSLLVLFHSSSVKCWSDISALTQRKTDPTVQMWDRC